MGMQVNVGGVIVETLMEASREGTEAALRDGGALLVKQVDDRIGLTRAAARVL